MDTLTTTPTCPRCGATSFFTCTLLDEPFERLLCACGFTGKPADFPARVKAWPSGKRIYIAGPMTGLPDFNYPAFHAAAKARRSQGHHVENPAENPVPACGSWLGYMRLALAQLVTCDELLTLPGWEKSKGAAIEVHLALQLGLSIKAAP